MFHTNFKTLIFISSKHIIITFGVKIMVKYSESISRFRLKYHQILYFI